MTFPRVDPLPAFNFTVALIDASSTFSTVTSTASGLLLGGFSECSGLEASLDITEYAEGGVNDRIHRFASRTQYSNIVLRRGVGLGEDLWLWYREFQAGEGTRRTGMIVMQNELRVPIKTWVFEGGIPVRFQGPALNAQTSEISIEALEIAHEKLTLISPGVLADDAISAIF
jgi:phage tail-like protein